MVAKNVADDSKTHMDDILSLDMSIDRKLVVTLSLLLAGIIMGFFWEFWNYLAVTKWYYNIPFLGFFKIFEMPVLGYLGYFPFAFELYAMYWFIRSLFVKRENLLIK